MNRLEEEIHEKYYFDWILNLLAKMKQMKEFNQLVNPLTLFFKFAAICVEHGIKMIDTFSVTHT